MNAKSIRRGAVTIGVLTLAIGAGAALRTYAGTGDSGSGFAWGGGVTANPSGYDGVGWISINSADCDTNGNGVIEASEASAHLGCPAGAIGNYGVKIPDTDGNLSGYGWSDGYGWVSFGDGTNASADLTGCPSGTCNARRVGNAIQGWARLLSVKTAAASGNSGGWSGWIQLDPPNGGITITGSSSPYPLAGYAYSDELGWLNFGPVGGFGGVKYTSSAVPGFIVCPTQMPSRMTVYTGVGNAVQMHAWYIANVASVSGTFSCTNYGSAVDEASTTTWSLGATPASTATINSTGLLTAYEPVPSAPSNQFTVTGTYASMAPVSIDIQTASLCTWDCTVAAASHCSTETSFTMQDTCGNTQTCSSGGTRNCSTTWKEVAP